MRVKSGIALMASIAVAAAITAGGQIAAASTTYGLQFAPSGYTAYTGWASGVDVATFTAPAFNTVNTTIYSLGGSGATFTITGNNYSLQNAMASGTPTTDIQWLNHSFLLGNGSTSLTAKLSGVSSGDTVDFSFLQSIQTGFEPQVSVDGGTPTAINSDISFIDAGSFSGQSSYTLTFTNAAGGAGEFDLSGGLITINPTPEPAAASLLFAGATGLALLRRRNI